MNAATAAISVVIRTKDSAATLGDVISRLGLTVSDELIVVDSGSQDATLGLAKKAGAKIVDLSGQPFSYGKSLNAGFSLARNDWILSLSSHCVPAEPDLLAKYRQALAGLAPEIGAVTGRAVAHARELKTDIMSEVCTPTDFAKGTYFTCGNPNCLYRKSIWTQHPFDEQIETAEDLEWSLWAFKNGISLMRLPNAAVFYRSRLGLPAMIKKGYTEARVARRLAPNPPLSVASLLSRIFWYFLALLRGRATVGHTARRIGYLLGDFWGRQSK
jgi:glycosyltransferase involved in cell wall biosynthesis